MNNKLNFEFIETITKKQANVSKWLLLYCMEKTVRSTSDREDKCRRQELFNDYKEKVMPDFENSSDFDILINQWWDDEIRRYYINYDDYNYEQLIDSMTYRMLAIFFRNHSMCPFVTENQKPDHEEFHENNQKLFKKFLNQSIKIIPHKTISQRCRLDILYQLFKKFINQTIKTISHKTISQRYKFNILYQLFKKFINQSIKIISHKIISQKCRLDILYQLKKAKNIDISEKIDLATNEIHDTDWKEFKGFLIGGATGIVTSLLLGPIIGGWIGSMAGLSGAAATSFGLALLGGGSLVSGGFGMLGGSIMLGTLFGVTSGIKGAKNVSISDLDIMQAGQLPVLLAVGCSMYEIGNIEIPSLIHERISERLEELKDRYKKISKQKDKKVMRNLMNIYEKAQEMSEPKGWVYNYSEYAA